VASWAGDCLWFHCACNRCLQVQHWLLSAAHYGHARKVVCAAVQLNPTVTQQGHLLTNNMLLCTGLVMPFTCNHSLYSAHSVAQRMKGTIAHMPPDMIQVLLTCAECLQPTVELLLLLSCLHVHPAALLLADTSSC
jgi:hypothetical protein